MDYVNGVIKGGSILPVFGNHNNHIVKGLIASCKFVIDKLPSRASHLDRLGKQPPGGARRLLMGECMERRRHERHDLTAPVKFAWSSRDGMRHDGAGTTRNLSARGLFIISEDAPPVGTTIVCKVNLNAARVESEVTVHARGLVRRVETIDSVGTNAGFSLAARRMKLERPEAS